MSNLNLNKVVLCGRLTANPELKTTQSGISVASFTLAVNRRYSKENQEVDFINCIAWRQTAEFISRYFSKGSSLAVTGSIQTRTWTDNNNQKRFATEVVVDEAMFVDGKNDNKPANEASLAEVYADNMQPVADDEDLPF